MESTSSACPLQHSQAAPRPPFLSYWTARCSCCGPPLHSPQPLLPSQLDIASLWPRCKCTPRSLDSDASLIIQNTCWQRPLYLLTAPQPTSLWPCAVPHSLEALALPVWAPLGWGHWGRGPYPILLFWLCCSRHPWQLEEGRHREQGSSFWGTIPCFLSSCRTSSAGNL